MASNMKRTGGPWKVGRGGDGNLAIYTDQLSSRSLVAGFKSGTVKEEDAELMAAAPELRQCVIELRKEIDEMAKRVGWSGNGARGRADLILAQLDAE